MDFDHRSKFSVRQVYEMSGIAALIDIESSHWSALWRFHGPLRHALLLWCVHHNCFFLTKQLLHQREICEDASYSVCGSLLESCLHEL